MTSKSPYDGTNYDDTHFWKTLESDSFTIPSFTALLLSIVNSGQAQNPGVQCSYLVKNHFCNRDIPRKNVTIIPVNCTRARVRGGSGLDICALTRTAVNGINLSTQFIKTNCRSTLDVVIQRCLDPKVIEETRRSSKGLNKRLGSLCAKCFFMKHKQCVHYKKLSMDKYRCFRVLSIRGEIAIMPSGLRPSMYSGGIQTSKGGGYDKGHLIAFNFGGPNCPFNLIPQFSAVNRIVDEVHGEYYELEGDIRGALNTSRQGKDNPGTGIMTVDVKYDDDDIIPCGLHVFVESQPESPESWAFGTHVYNYGRGNAFSPLHTK